MKEKEKNYFYEKLYARSDYKTYAKRYSRSFKYGKDPKYTESELYYGEDSIEEPEGSKEPNINRPGNSLEASISRARSRVRLLAFSNPDLIGLLTLTFADIPTEQSARKQFNVYRQKVARHYKRTPWRFLGVKELQKRGSIHYHLLVNFCPGEVLRPLWDNPNQIQSDLWPYISDYRIINGDDAFKTELYLLKYLTKGKSKIFAQYYVRSRNLIEIQPRYISERLPFPPFVDHIFTTIISNNYVENFTVTEYTYDRYNYKE